MEIQFVQFKVSSIRLFRPRDRQHTSTRGQADKLTSPSEQLQCSLCASSQAEAEAAAAADDDDLKCGPRICKIARDGCCR